ncbi:MAG: CBS domain-containing protein [Elusimicrobia bacterium]|nr:CBS domain-containing protein [Elusimicrobiota bacterium]MDE2236800.1 CBS domain-containing protein [Elusimicrobiota bacterium]MDE2426143.1 CBS domain-containing protein [Elusimicrobiota bacterium]
MSLKTKALTEKVSRVARARPVTIAPSASIKDALLRMRERRTPCLLVCEGSRLVGVFTERDYLMKVAGRSGGKEPVRDFMTPKPVRASFDDTIGTAAEAMDSRGLRQLPLVDGEGRPASVVAVELIVQYLAENFPAAALNRPPDPRQRAEEPEGA